MPVYVEKTKNKNGDMIDKKVDGQKQYYIRTYIQNEFGESQQITRHNKKWLGRDGYNHALQEEIRIKNSIFKSARTIKRNNQEDEKITFEQLYQLKKENDIIYNKNRDATRITYDDKFYKHIMPVIGSNIIQNICYKDCLKLIEYLNNYIIDSGANKGHHLSTKSKNDIIMIASSILEFGVTFHKLKENYFKNMIVEEDKDEIKKINPIELFNKQVIISPSDWLKVTNAMEELYNEAALQNKYSTLKKSVFLTVEYILMTRVGETQGMKYSNINHEHKMYILYEAWNKRSKKMTPTKNGKGRILYMTDILYQMINKLYEIDSKMIGFRDDDLIFHGLIDKQIPISRNTIDVFRRKVFKKAGVDYVSNHRLRHAGISNAMFSGVDASALSDMTGHDKKIMFDTYVHTLKSANYNLINTLDNIAIPNIKIT